MYQIQRVIVVPDHLYNPRLSPLPQGLTPATIPPDRQWTSVHAGYADRVPSWVLESVVELWRIGQADNPFAPPPPGLVDIRSQPLNYDQYGFPLHTNGPQGTNCNLGALLRWGVILAGDAAVVRRHPLLGWQVLLALRSDNLRWAFPGGKAEKGEDPLATGIRELSEETGYRLPDWLVQLGPMHILSCGPIMDYRQGDHNWIESLVALWRVDYFASLRQPLRPLRGELSAVRWRTVRHLQAEEMSPGHDQMLMLLKAALT